MTAVQVFLLEILTALAFLTLGMVIGRKMP